MEVYDKKALWAGLVYFAVMVAAMRYTGGAGFAIFIPLVLLAVLQNRVEKLMLLMLVTVVATVGNGVLMPKTTIASASQKLVLMMSAVMLLVKLMGRRHSRLVTPLLGMLVYLLFMVLSSLQGWSPLISGMKMVLFSAGYFAFYALANAVILDRATSTRKIRAIYLSACCFLIFGSMLLLPFPGMSQMQMEEYVEAVKAGANVTSLFCGMTFHPQAFGPLVGTMFVLILADMLFSVRKVNKLMFALLLCCPFLIYKTSSRTALGTMLAGTMYVMYLFMKTRQIGARWKNKVVSIGLMTLMLFSVALMVTPGGRKSAAQFLTKRAPEEVAEVSVESVVSSRQGLMERALYNFRQKPIIGNGFQVSESMEGSERGGLRSILSAPVEKGVWLTAVLEEGGIVGWSIFVLFIVVALRKLVQRKGYCSASVFFTIVVLNMGEFTMFSVSGIGGFYWCLCFVGAIMDAHRLREMNLTYFIMSASDMGPQPVWGRRGP